MSNTEKKGLMSMGEFTIMTKMDVGINMITALFQVFLLIHWLKKFTFINKNYPNEPVYIYNFQHSTVYIQTFFYKYTALLSYIIYLICKFIHSILKRLVRYQLFSFFHIVCSIKINLIVSHRFHNFFSSSVTLFNQYFESISIDDF